MKQKSKINYWELVSSTRELLTNNNFRNNQNYIVSDFIKFEFSRRYYKTFFNKNLWNFFTISFSLLLGLNIFFRNIWFELFMALNFIIWFFIFILILLMFYDRFVYFFYKKYSFIKKNHIFSSKRLIIKKDYKLSFTRSDFISFKK